MGDGWIAKATCFGAGVLASLAAYLLANRLRKPPRGRISVVPKKNSSVENEEVCEVLFFPDSAQQRDASKRGLPKAYHYLYGDVMYKNCRKEGTPLQRLIKHLEAAKKSIDLCLFVVNSHQLTDAVLGNFRRNKDFRVRLIVDEKSFSSWGSAVPKFVKWGAQVKSPGSAASYHDGYLMHHKFAIIDDRVLITGSFNWTMQAIIGNKENLIITSDPRLVQPFVREFRKIWAQLDDPAVPSEEEGWLS